MVSIGVMFRREQAPETLGHYARRVEALGFDEIWVVEDCFYMGGIAQSVAALAATERITVGIGIVPAVARNAAFLAMEFATIAQMYPNRFHAGIGHGVADWMEQIGATPSSWLASLEETTNAVRAVMRGETVTTDGRHVRLRDVELHRPPPHVPPVSLGVRGPRSLALAGRCADGTILAENPSPTYVSWAWTQVDTGATKAGRDEHHRVTVYANCVVSSENPDGARDHARRATASMLGGEATVQTSQLPYAEELVRLGDQGYGALYEGLQDTWLDDLAITGTPDRGAESIRRLSEAGADSVILVPPVDADPNAWLETVGVELLPLMR